MLGTDASTELYGSLSTLIFKWWHLARRQYGLIQQKATESKKLSLDLTLKSAQPGNLIICRFYSISFKNCAEKCI